jgi:hypothetical protein
VSTPSVRARCDVKRKAPFGQSWRVLPPSGGKGAEYLTAPSTGRLTGRAQLEKKW